MATNVSTPLPTVTLREGSTITVDVGPGGPTITQLILHGFQVIPDTTVRRPPILITGR